MFATLIVLSLAWLAWRLWRFTILPILAPSTIKELPYSIPLLGHAISLYRDIDGTLTNGREYFQNTRETFTLTVAGHKIYIMTSASNIGDVLRSLKIFDNGKPKAFLMKKFGISQTSIDTLYEKPDQALSRDGPSQSSPPTRSMAIISEALIKRQFFLGKTYDEFETRLLTAIDDRMRWKSLAAEARLKSKTSDKLPQTVSLFGLVGQTLVGATTLAFFGEKIFEINPNIVDDFLHFDSNVQVFLQKLPTPWTSSVETAVEKLRRTIQLYLQVPRDQRQGEAWLIGTLQDELESRNIKTEDIAGWLAMLYWAMNTNTWRLGFWVSAYILNDPRLLEDVRKEIMPQMQDSSSLPSLHSRLADCERLSSVYHEVLRLVDSAISVRESTRTHVMATAETIPAGAMVMLSHRQLLLDDDVWGSDAKSFNPNRFLLNKSLFTCKSFTPFGGGALLCPGRYMARGEVLLFTAFLIHRFDVETISEFPRLDTKNGAGVGILGPKQGDDFILQLSPRE